MSKKPVTFTATMMRQRLGMFKRVVLGRAVKGLAAAGEMLMIDAITVEPKCPVDTTSLIGSASVFVEGEKKADSPFGVPGTASRYDPSKVYVDYKAVEGEDTFAPDILEAVVVFNAPYAAKQHEEWPDKFEPGCGIHFMSTKIGMFHQKYRETIYKAIDVGK